MRQLNGKFQRGISVLPRRVWSYPASLEPAVRVPSLKVTTATEKHIKHGQNNFLRQGDMHNLVSPLFLRICCVGSFSLGKIQFLTVSHCLSLSLFFVLSLSLSLSGNLDRTSLGWVLSGKNTAPLNTFFRTLKGTGEMHRAFPCMTQRNMWVSK